jgi:hypothetical protein
MDEIGVRRERRDLRGRRRSVAAGDPPVSSGAGERRRGPSRSRRTLAVALADAATVAVKVQVPEGGLTRELVGDLVVAALSGVDVTVVGGRDLAGHDGTATLRECGVTVVVTDIPPGDDLVFVTVDRAGDVGVGPGLPMVGEIGRALVLDAFNRWTLRGRSA